MGIDEAAVRQALLRQAEDADDHDLSLIDQCLALTPEERLDKLAAWVNLIAEMRAGSPRSPV